MDSVRLAQKDILDLPDLGLDDYLGLDS
jgi:hypothetical protein